MRKITIEMASAFENNENKTLSNTEVKDNKMYLWGNCIAKKENGKTYINMCGYNTNTTRERLNGLSGVNIKSKDFTPYLNGIKISSCGWYEVK